MKLKTLCTVKWGELECFSAFLWSTSKIFWKLQTKKHLHLLYLTPLPCIKIQNFNCSLQSHTLIGTFSRPIGIFWHVVSGNDLGYLELTIQNTSIYQLFLSPSPINVNRFCVPVQLKRKKPVVIKNLILCYLLHLHFCDRILIYHFFQVVPIL